jgi:hypothetical protein
LIKPFVERIETASNVRSLKRDLALSAAWTIAGTCYSETREPLAGAQVTMFVQTAADPRTLDLALLKLKRQGIAAGRSTLHSRLDHATYATSTQTAADGSFVVEFMETGDGLLRVQAAGFAAQDIELGLVSGSRENLQVELRPAETRASVRFTRESNPLGGWKLTFVDVTRLGAQLAYGPFETKADGVCETDVLQSGRQYFLMASYAAPGSNKSEESVGYFRWSGQRDIDLARDLRSERE